MRRCGAVGKLTSAIAIALAVAAAPAAAAVSDTVGKTSLEQRLAPTSATAFDFLGIAPGEPYTVRQDLGSAAANRAQTRTSLVYFGQLSDFQLADEESPARVEVVDPLATPTFPVGAAWRPWEALNPHIDEAMIQQINQFTAASPVADGSGTHRAMDLTIDTGDSADSQQLNETLWVRTLLEGGTLKPNSGVPKATYNHPLCPNLLVPGA
jgi:hypothetical protein